MPRNRYGGRRTAHNPEAADIWGRVRADRFDLPAEAPPYRPSPQEQARAEFGALSQQDQDSLTGWIVASISKAIPRAPYDGGPKTGLLRASTLAQQASSDMGQPITAAMIAGACLDLGFETVTSGPNPSDLRICAVWKD
jgi:hypothetical protein